MISNEEQVRAAIAEQAADWLVANDEGLDARESAALAAWLKVSPVHVEEFLRVSMIARDLREARTDPEYSLETVLAQAQSDDDTPVRPLWPRVAAPVSGLSSRRWLPARGAGRGGGGGGGGGRWVECWLALVVESPPRRTLTGRRRHPGTAPGDGARRTA